tara:strand:- start:135 stop:512 length:378 start_codon:yes stop_codon:yes gene_type:complete
MRKYFSLILIFSVCLGDTLILKNNKVYNGKLIKYVDGRKIMFRALPSANILININEIHELTLTDGTKIFKNGEILVYDLKSIEKYRYEKASSCIITSALIFGIAYYFFINADNSPNNTSFSPHPF